MKVKRMAPQTPRKIKSEMKNKNLKKLLPLGLETSGWEVGAVMGLAADGEGGVRC